MTHVRKGKTAKRNRQLRALDRLRGDLARSDRLAEQWSKVGKEPTRLQIKYRLRIKAEIAVLEARI